MVNGICVSGRDTLVPRRSQAMMKRPESHGEQYVVRFEHQSVVDRYHLRPSYPPQTFELLTDLIVDEPRVVLDVGCGTGKIARPWWPRSNAWMLSIGRCRCSRARGRSPEAIHPRCAGCM